jgi:hypothetical protein
VAASVQRSPSLTADGPSTTRRRPVTPNATP